MRDCMDNRVTPPERVTSPTWSPAPPCNQPLLSERKLWTKQTRLWTRLPFNAPLRITDCIKFTDRNDALRNKKKKTNKKDFAVCYMYLQYLQSCHTQSQKDSYETLDIIQQQPKLKHIFKRVIDCLLQEGKISQEHSSPRENSFNLATITKSTKRSKAN